MVVPYLRRRRDQQIPAFLDLGLPRGIGGDLVLVVADCVATSSSR